MRINFLRLVLVALLLGNFARTAHASNGNGPNVLVFLIDDAGFEDMTPATMPTLNAYAPFGRAYTRFYAECVCSPSRYALNAGKYGSRAPAYIGSELLVQSNQLGAPTSDIMLAEVFAANGYATALFGKWHVSGQGTVAINEGPRIHGYQTWRAGIAGNIVGQSHYGWTRVDDGVQSFETTYTTRAVADELRAWWTSTDGPKFGVCAYPAPHEPFESAKASGMLPLGWPPATTDRTKYESALRAIDTALQEAASYLDLSNTYVFVLPDNGTPNRVGLLPPGALEKGYKLTPYEGGCNVPLYVWGPTVAPGVDDALLGIVDLPRTFLDLAGIAAPIGFEDSVSFAHVLDGTQPSARAYAWVHKFLPNDGHAAALTEDRWCVVRSDGLKLLSMVGVFELYDLVNDPHEHTDLAGDPAYALDVIDLAAARDAILGPGWKY